MASVKSDKLKKLKIAEFGAAYSTSAGCAVCLMGQKMLNKLKKLKIAVFRGIG